MYQSLLILVKTHLNLQSCTCLQFKFCQRTKNWYQTNKMIMIQSFWVKQRRPLKVATSSCQIRKNWSSLLQVRHLIFNSKTHSLFLITFKTLIELLLKLTLKKEVRTMIIEGRLPLRIHCWSNLQSYSTIWTLSLIKLQCIDAFQLVISHTVAV